MVIIFRILVLADIHGNIRATTKILKIIQKQNFDIDLVFIAGDLPKTTPIGLMLQYIVLHRNLAKSEYTRWVYKGGGRPQFVRKQIDSVRNIIPLLSTLEVPIVYVPGNVDCYEVQQLLKNWSVSELYFLDANTIKLKDFLIMGLGGSQIYLKNYDKPLCDMEFSTQDFKSRVNLLYDVFLKTGQSTVDFLITHEPPAFQFKTNNNFITGGSTSITNLINRVKPRTAIFGHYHEFPLVKKVKNTVYVNPGPLACYKFSIIDIKEKSIQSIALKKLNPIKYDTIHLIYSSREVQSDFKEKFRFD